jgi:predicted Zn-ribbon and HTH transcriptional regulator
MDIKSDWSGEIGRLVSLAERFAAEGQMNLSKLVEAAVYAQIRRAGWRYQPAVTKDTMAMELASGLQFLRQEDHPIELIAALESGLQSLEEHRPGDLSILEAPDAHVCRTCGYAALNSAPERCPVCGSWPGRFRKFVAIFNQDNTDALDPLAIVSMLANNADDLTRLVGDLSEEATTKAPPGVDWSIREHVAHFADTQDMLDTRLDLMLAQDNPDLVALAVYEFATDTNRRPPTTHEILSSFREKRADCVARLKTLPLKDLWRTGRHPEFGQITILRQAGYMAFHEQTHLPEIEALRAYSTGIRP